MRRDLSVQAASQTTQGCSPAAPSRAPADKPAKDQRRDNRLSLAGVRLIFITRVGAKAAAKTGNSGDQTKLPAKVIALTPSRVNAHSLVL